ncbi:MAG TPA: 1-acyl-sn-glycerol-3-phosphate acyltransferase, partial [Caulobacteraceae bacterium]|nr:1-acyl-sn-glycerol-3-phosphate acyltransferase [Caulobacteraceae bacterium]
MTAVRSLAFVALFYLWSTIVAIGMMPLLILPRSWTVRAMRLWGEVVMALVPVCGIRVEFRGREHIPTGP